MEKNIDISLEEGPPAEIDGHAGLLAILLRNLVDNAVRYTPPGGTVRARVASSPILFEIRDSGPGVPETELGRLGERFHRLAPPGESGSGLGLSIVLRIAELHGARVRFAPGLDGRGLAVSVDFGKNVVRP